jgi:hypothetical protein
LTCACSASTSASCFARWAFCINRRLKVPVLSVFADIKIAWCQDVRIPAGWPPCCRTKKVWSVASVFRKKGNTELALARF